MWRCLCSTTLTSLCRVQKWEQRSCVTQFTRKYTRRKLLRVYKRIRSIQYTWFITSLRFQEIRSKLFLPILRDSRFVDSILLIVVANPLQFDRIWDLWTLCSLFYQRRVYKIIIRWKNLKRSRDKNTAEEHTCERRSRGMQNRDTIWKRVSSREKIGEKEDREGSIFIEILSRWSIKLAISRRSFEGEIVSRRSFRESCSNCCNNGPSNARLFLLVKF